MAVSLNIVLQKAPVSNDQGFFIFFNLFEIGGLSSIRIMLCAVFCFVKHQVVVTRSLLLKWKM
jgi:hypothetical protein